MGILFYQSLPFNVGNLSVGSIASLATNLIYAALGIIIVGFVVMFLVNKYRYKYRAVIERRRKVGEDEPGTTKPLLGKAAYVTKGGRDIFRIKYGMGMPWQTLDLLKLPDPKYMDSQNTVYYLQYQKGALVQAEKKIDWENGNVTIEPIDNLSKTAAIIDFNDRVSSLEKPSFMNQYGAPIGIVILFTLAIIGMWFVSKTC